MVHGLINKAIQCFLRDTYGESTWQAIAREARLGHDGFEPMLKYDAGDTEAMVAAASRLLDRPREAMLEDLGTYLVSHPNLEALRRLLRFGGVGFTDFLHSLEDMPGRARLALPDLELPQLDLAEVGPDRFRLRCQSRLGGAGHVMVGLLRAMADDYGALVVLDHLGVEDDVDVIVIRLLDHRHTDGRPFQLAAKAV